MNLTLRGKIFLGIGLGVLFIIIIILLAIFWKRQPSPAPTNTLTNASVNTSNNNLNTAPTTTTITPVKLTQEEVKVANNELAIKNVAKNFVERFGSYSMEANFSNFAEIQDLVTPTVAAWLKIYPEDLKKKNPLGFESVTTLALSQKIENLQKNKASVIVSTQRQQRINGVDSLSYNDMKLNLVLSKGVWLVDG